MQYRAAIIALASILSLSACQANTEDQSANEPEVVQESAPPAGEPTETVSILRSDIEQPPLPDQPVSSFELTVGFPEGGDDLDEQALEALAEIADSEQIAMGGPIVLRAHSDSAGSDNANARAAEARGLAVAGWLVDQGIDDDRIDLIVFGEQNPIEPNALPDGSPNEEGRALNRRVEVLVLVPAPTVEAATESVQSGD
ncbi:hypothetical protein CD351_01485 [Erythrobacter sp. KY5]|uniref:OmpA family protein n=1 Tax=Erythrobacter sp. KY5 TaxID=2011159 RepID=UPI000DBF1744|nr:OmpA family protein [Erythrobacter sp. KY5]AWW73092.1 hypothetical protein CD351_01485 [Erythrobacter sp. KY5]